MAARRKLSKPYNSVKYRNNLKKRKASAKAFKLFFLSITGLVLFSIAFYLYTLTLVLKEPFVKANGSTDFSNNTYNSTGDFNVLFAKLTDLKEDSAKITELYLYKISSVDGFVIIYNIPTNTVVEGFAKESVAVSDLYFLGNAGDEKRGVSNLKKYILKNFAIGVDGYVLYDNTTASNLENIGIKIDNQNVLSSIRYRHFINITKIFDILRQNIKSDLSSIEAFKLVTDTKNIKVDKFKFVELSSETVGNYQLLDDYWREYNNLELTVNFRNTAIVLNSTPTKGLALWGSRLVKNTGATVIDVGNFEKEFDETTIYTNNYDLPLVNYLTKNLKIKKVKSTDDFLEDPSLASRADVLLILGKDTGSLY